jgi:large subunit ribosomal protein L23|tara:strand:- start:905 stop:1195 length:291 start_codon:yes stop_codon:yes gene_type:complete
VSEPAEILLEALLTEKATLLSASNKYLFKVHSAASKTNVSQSVERTFGVTVTKVNIINQKPKLKRDRTRRNRLGSKGGMKKAIVTLKQGDAIEFGA